MKTYLFYYILLIVLVVTDAWLLSHPNLIGHLGVWFYKYWYLKTFPRALATVSLLTVVSLLLSEIVKRKLKKSLALTIKGLLSVFCIVICIQVFMQFTSGTYKMTGSGFKTGAIILPIILLLIFIKGLWDVYHIIEIPKDENSEIEKNR